MKCGMIPHFIIFAAAFAGLTAATEETTCSPVKIDWSTETPVYSTCCDVTMFCEVYIGNTTLTNSTNINWSVPIPQNSKMSYQREFSDDGHKLKASVTLKSITKNDEGLYNVTFSNMCGSVSCQSSLSVTSRTCSRRPDPVQKNVNINVPQNMLTLTLAANFSGNRDLTCWKVIWSNSSASNLGNYSSKYHTEHQVVSDCLFTEKLIIHNVSMSDAGLYFANVFGSSDTGVNTTFYVNIMNQGDQERKNAKGAVFAVLLSIIIAVLLLIIAVLLSVVGGIMYLKRGQKKRRHSES